MTALVRAQQGLSAGDRLKNRLLDYDPQFPWNRFSGRNLIAVEGDLEGTAKKILDEASNTFKSKDEHFLALRREVNHLNAARIR